MPITSAIILGATGQTGSALLHELLSSPSPVVERIVAFGNTRMPIPRGPHTDRATAKQVGGLKSAMFSVVDILARV